MKKYDYLIKTKKTLSFVYFYTYKLFMNNVQFCHYWYNPFMTKHSDNHIIKNNQ